MPPAVPRPLPVRHCAAICMPTGSRYWMAAADQGAERSANAERVDKPTSWAASSPWSMHVRGRAHAPRRAPRDNDRAMPASAWLVRRHCCRRTALEPPQQGSDRVNPKRCLPLRRATGHSRARELERARDPLTAPGRSTSGTTALVTSRAAGLDVASANPVCRDCVLFPTPPPKTIRAGLPSDWGGCSETCWGLNSLLCAAQDVRIIRGSSTISPRAQSQTGLRAPTPSPPMFRRRHYGTSLCGRACER